MDQGIAMIISAAIAIVSAGAGSFLAIWGDKITKKNDFKDKHLYDTYLKRIAIYEDVLKALADMTSRDELPMNITAQEIAHKIPGCVHELDSFVFRLSVLGSDSAVNILYSIIFAIRGIEGRPEDMAEAAYAAYLRATFCNTIRNGLISFTRAVREESGAARLDARLAEFMNMERKPAPKNKRGKNKVPK